ncbi:hypothetical protein CEP54_003996 [Fusarium duplospermum]|uniref:Uncharacterized protein n=1 Tax=Fusarium duplospermum TaxID=1325734 RepID=A0A428QKQ4_9HYPO|nr:hypothetical protein CEP54_003996 [Fusarium duplospermum]
MTQYTDHESMDPWAQASASFALSSPTFAFSKRSHASRLRVCEWREIGSNISSAGIRVTRDPQEEEQATLRSGWGAELARTRAKRMVLAPLLKQGAWKAIRVFAKVVTIENAKKKFEDASGTLVNKGLDRRSDRRELTVFTAE